MKSADSSAALRRDAGAKSAALRDWLLRGPAQLRAGEEAGGVAGALDVDGNPRYVYAEITGYYLSWLADIAGVEGDAAALAAARANAVRALAWATKSCGQPGRLPLTRVHLGPAEPDWRNDAIFFFDLAMLLRGIDAATEARLVDDPMLLRATLHGHLAQFVDGGTLRAAIQVRGTHALPQRWSTLGGPFLVKAAARVTFGTRHASPYAALARACAHESDRWAAQAADIDLGMLHPTLYFAEGLLLSRPDRADAVAAQLRRILDQTLPDGSLPETAGEFATGAARVRNDILAQALRVGVLLRELRADSAPTPDALDRLAASVLTRIGERDFASFDAGTSGQPNVWCTMFAEQALRWYADGDGGDVRAVRRPDAAALV
jgi:hypothetical protein